MLRIDFKLAVAISFLSLGIVPAECVQYGYVSIPTECPPDQLSGYDVYDIDSDGDEDIVYCCRLDSTIRLLRAVDSRQTDYRQEILPLSGPETVFPFQLLFQDIDADGLKDLVVVGSSTQTAWHRNPGTGGGPWQPHALSTLGVRGFFLDVTGDGLPDFVPATLRTGVTEKILIHPGLDNLGVSLWPTSDISISELGVRDNPDLNWAPVELDGDPATKTLVGFPSSLIRVNVTGNHQFTAVNFPTQNGWVVGYNNEVNFLDADLDGVDELLYRSSTGVVGVEVPRGAATGNFPFATLFAAPSSFASPLFGHIYANEDSIPDLLLSQRTGSPAILKIAKPDGTFDDDLGCILTGEQSTRANYLASPRLRPIGPAPQRILIPGTGAIKVAYPLQSFAELKFAFLGSEPQGFQPGTTALAEVTITNQGGAELPPSVVRMAPSSGNHVFDQYEVSFPAVPEGESMTLPVSLTVLDNVACGAEITGTFHADFGARRTLPVSYLAQIGEEIGADRTYADGQRIAIPDGTGAPLRRVLETPPLTPPITGYRLAVEIISAPFNHLVVEVYDENKQVTTLYNGDVSESGRIELSTRVANPSGLSNGGSFTLFVTDNQQATPATLESWSVTIERPRIECVPANQGKVVDVLLGASASIAATDSNIDGALDAADLPVVFPD